ncbi:hypothetical protein [uncultured Salinicola sp.]|uniref:hypothetical protein n=1 Tax=uncultured Salinicola sp. TaxID=1193542 RepID=UPI0026062C26|nr:hypothetical protein [uncultured Salinicola sp.]|tara:strand:- start:7814 stop:8224 length:411 start_codon:yes stop_codon:yes gene_type:complete
MGNSWHYYAFMAVTMLIGNALFAWRKGQGHFDGFGKGKLFLAQGVCILAPIVLIGIPYASWSLSGFQQADARDIERMMEDKYVSDDSIMSADADFIITSRSTMKGNVSLGFVDGTSDIAKCNADMGTDGKYLVSCE